MPLFKIKKRKLRLPFSLKDNHISVSAVLSVLAVLISVSALFIAIYTASLTKDAVELAAGPVIGIVLDKNQTQDDSNKVLTATGLLPTENSILNLIVRNNSLSSIEDVDIRMTLWKIYVDDNTHHLTVCPLGYVSHRNNPNFAIPDNLGIDNIFNNTFSLKKGGEYPITIDFSNLKYIKLESEHSKILLRINVDYIKSISQTNHNYTKLYNLTGYYDVDSEKHYVVDPDIAPDSTLILNDKKNEKDNFPSRVYPFQEEEFLEYFKGPIRKLDLLPTACAEFSLKKEERVITY